MSPQDFNKKYKLSLVSNGEKWPGIDYAILTFDENIDFKNLVLKSTDTIEVGKNIFILGYPAGSEVSYDSLSDPEITEGKISSVSAGGDVNYFVVDITTTPGSSGSPVFDESGKVIGILTAGDKYSNFNFILPSEHVINALKSGIK